MKRNIKQHTFNGRKYKIDYNADHVGRCDSPAGAEREVEIRAGLKPKEHLEVCIHEALHALDFDKSEVRVDMVGRELANWLWRLGYRKE